MNIFLPFYFNIEDIVELFPNFLNFSEVTLFDIIQILASILLGGVAIFVASRANKLNKDTLSLTTQSMEHEKKMRLLEVDISLFESRFDVLNEIGMYLYKTPYSNINKEVFHKLRIASVYLFPQHIHEKIVSLLELSQYKAANLEKLQTDYETIKGLCLPYMQLSILRPIDKKKDGMIV